MFFFAERWLEGLSLYKWTLYYVALLQGLLLWERHLIKVAFLLLSYNSSSYCWKVILSKYRFLAPTGVLLHRLVLWERHLIKVRIFAAVLLLGYKADKKVFVKNDFQDTDL
jgi:hypothetical protein